MRETLARRPARPTRHGNLVSGNPPVGGSPDLLQPRVNSDAQKLSAPAAPEERDSLCQARVEMRGPRLVDGRVERRQRADNESDEIDHAASKI